MIKNFRDQEQYLCDETESSPSSETKLQQNKSQMLLKILRFRRLRIRQEKEWDPVNPRERKRKDEGQNGICGGEMVLKKLRWLVCFSCCARDSLLRYRTQSHKNNSLHIYSCIWYLLYILPSLPSDFFFPFFVLKIHFQLTLFVDALDLTRNWSEKIRLGAGFTFCACVRIAHLKKKKKN